MNLPTRQRHLQGVALTAAGVAVLSPDGLLTTLVAAGTWTQVFWRGLFMGLALGAFVLLRARGRPGAAVRAVLRPGQLSVGALFAASSVAWVLAIVATSVANTLFITASAPLFAALLTWLFLREGVTARTVAAIFVAIAGMAIIFAEGIGRGDLAGNLFALVTALCWAGMIVVLRAKGVGDPAPGLALGGFLVALGGLAVAPTLVIAGLDIVWLALLGLLVLPLSFFLIGLGPRHLPAPEVGLIMLLEAVLGPLWAWAIIAQMPSPATLAGGAVVLATLALHFAIGLRRERDPAQTPTKS